MPQLKEVTAETKKGPKENKYLNKQRQAEVLALYYEGLTVQQISEKFNTKMEQLIDHSIVGNARSIGLIGAIELVKNKKSKTYFDPKIAIGTRIVKNAQRNGLIVRALQGDIVALCPPLIINSKELDILFKKFNKSIEDTAVELNTEGLM